MVFGSGTYSIKDTYEIRFTLHPLHETNIYSINLSTLTMKCKLSLQLGLFHILVVYGGALQPQDSPNILTPSQVHSKEQFSCSYSSLPTFDHTITSMRNHLVGAFWGLFAGDALAMPVHWYYSLDQLKRDFGRIEGYVKPKLKLPNSILSLSNTGGGGR